EMQSPALLKIKSHKVVSSEDTTTIPETKLEKSLSGVISENTIGFDEIMFRISSKCHKVMKYYLTMERERYNAIAMAPWVIPQIVRLQFIKYSFIINNTVSLI